MCNQQGHWRDKDSIALVATKVENQVIKINGTYQVVPDESIIKHTVSLPLPFSYFLAYLSQYSTETVTEPTLYCSSTNLISQNHENKNYRNRLKIYSVIVTGKVRKTNRLFSIRISQFAWQLQTYKRSFERDKKVVNLGYFMEYLLKIVTARVMIFAV